MQLSIVVAIADDGAIGRDGTLPWHQPADLKFFKSITLHKPIIMGRKTWESLGKPLKDRLNIVLTKNEPVLPEGVLACKNLEEALETARQHGFEEASIIGGASVFQEASSLASKLFITRVHTHVPDADTFFPQLEMDQWQLAWEEVHEADEKNKFPYTFQRWERRA